VVVVVVDSLALHPPCTRRSLTGGRIDSSSKLHSNSNDDNEDEAFVFDRTKSKMSGEQNSVHHQETTTSSSKNSEGNYDYIDDLTPPAINLKRDSILFSENPSTQRNNSALDLWLACKTDLPAVFTGAWPWRDSNLANDNPGGALYNIAFVRMPVILVGLVYGKNLFQGHPLIMDIGDGPFEMSPLIVIAVLALILA
jgi:hypothetical protein